MTDRVRVERDVQAPPRHVWELIADLERMPQWSPESERVTWIDRAEGPAVGARFRGRNRNGWHRWTTTGRVTDADPGRRFAFEVSSFGLPVARWQYDLEERDGATHVVETWTDNRGLLMKVLGRVGTGVADRATHNRDTMRITLDNLAATAEEAG